MKGISAEEVFTKIYRSNIWGGEKSVSGKGSDYSQTQAVMDYLSEIFRKYSISTMLDIPCGDYEWMRKVEKEDIKYVGADIVDALISENNQKYYSENVCFKKLNLIEDELPKVDLVFVRDCLVHLSYDDIWRSLRNIKKSGSRYLLTTSFVKRKKNKNILTGRWRALNLMCAPFSFPEPIEIFNESCTEGNGRYSDKSLCLWDLSKIELLN